MKLDLTNASVIVDAALENARKCKIRPLCIAVLDDGGNLKALKRDDGASILRPQIAIGKAWAQSAWENRAATLAIGSKSFRLFSTLYHL